MTEIEKQELNEKIGELLGFKKKVSKYGTHYTYPKEYEYLVSSTPNNALPDFMELINFSISLSEKFKYGIPRQYCYEKEDILEES